MLGYVVCELTYRLKLLLAIPSCNQAKSLALAIFVVHHLEWQAHVYAVEGGNCGL